MSLNIAGFIFVLASSLASCFTYDLSIYMYISIYIILENHNADEL